MKKGGVYPGRCGLCKLFPGNGIKCKNDTKNRGKIYANDYKCDNCQEAE